MTVFLLMLGFVLFYWGVEAFRLRRALQAIPIRIHVNGSRGKSSVTRLLAAALRGAGMRTVAKTTGSKARFIFPDGSEEPVVRLGTPNICEQIGVLDLARKQKADVIVMECMAIRPDLQRITEKRILHSTHGIITNVRADHLDVMGPTVEDAALALSSTIPKNGMAVMGDSRHSDILRKVAKKRNSTLQIADLSSLPAGAMDGFNFIEHEENVATTLLVTRALGISDAVALQGMHRVTPDPGACTRSHLERGGVHIEFLNIFAANDLESTISIWKKLHLRKGGEETTFALLNLRADRIDRSLQFAEVVEINLQADYYILVGGISRSVMRRFERRVPEERLLVCTEESPAAIFDRVAGMSPGKARVGGIGNIGGIGHEILRFLAENGGARC